jgi:hypothetical protein
MTCGTEYWHDFVSADRPTAAGSGWRYYYRPAMLREEDGQGRLFA